jgi:Ca2+-binding RTX toxin-like protein
MRKVTGTLGTAALLIGLVVSPAQSGGGATCIYDADIDRVKISLVTGSARVRRSGDDIVFSRGGDNYLPCDGATVHNTDRIVLTSHNTEFDHYMAVDMSNGRFAPGKTREASGASEIEIDVTFEPNPTAQFVIYGTPQSDRIQMGSKGAKLNGDDDVDMQIVKRFAFRDVVLLGGNDFATYSGGFGTGRPVSGEGSYGNAIAGGPGDDELIGGPGTTLLAGQSGADRLVGKSGPDTMSGNSGWDRLFGKKGHDDMDGNDGNDHLEGNEGNDFLHGQEGDDHLDGDSGRDFCSPGPGTDTKEDCET